MKRKRNPLGIIVKYKARLGPFEDKVTEVDSWEDPEPFDMLEFKLTI